MEADIIQEPRIDEGQGKIWHATQLNEAVNLQESNVEYVGMTNTLLKHFYQLILII